MGDPTKYKKSQKVLIVLRGLMQLGTKIEPKAAYGREAMIEQDCFPAFAEGEYHNVYFELNDGDYISPHAMEFFNSKEPNFPDYVGVKFFRKSTILEIPIHDKLLDLMHRYKHHDVYKKLDFLARTEVVSSLSFESLTLMAKNIHLVNCKYGQVMMRSGETSHFLNIVRKGTVTVSR